MDNFSCAFIILIFDADVAEDNIVAGVIPHPPVRITFLFELGTHVDAPRAFPSQTLGAQRRH